MRLMQLGIMALAWLYLSATMVQPAVPPSAQAPDIMPIASQNTPTPPVSVDFYNVPIQDVLRALSIQQNVNIVADPQVKGNVTIHLDNLSFDKGLQLIVETVGATFNKEGDLYRVSPKVQETKTVKDNQKFSLNLDQGRLTLQADHAELKDILQAIASESQINLTFNNTVRGTVSANLIDVELFSGIDTLLQNSNYTLEQRGDIYAIEKAARKEKFSVTYQNGKLSLNANEAAIKDLLQEISLQTGISIVSSAYVKGTVNAVIKNKDIETVIELILMGSDFQYRKRGQVYVIGNGDDLKAHSRFFTESKLFRLKHLRAEEVIEKLPPSIPTTNLQFFEEQNAIAISGSPALVKQVEDLLEQIDKPVPQIKVDVLIVEYDLSANKTHGLSLTGVQGRFGSPHTSFDFDPSVQNTLNFTYDVAESLSEAFRINLQALIEDDKAKVTANPSIWALNGKEATIDVITEDRFRELRFNEVSGRLEPVGVPRTIESGVKLKIKPWITGDHEINLEIEPEVSSATGALSSDDLPQTTKRKAKTVLKIKNGRTIVIGGLIQTTYERSENRTPILSNIPILGKAFQNKSKKEQRTELVFYITPTISHEGDVQDDFDKDKILAVEPPPQSLKYGSSAPQPILEAAATTPTAQPRPQEVLPQEKWTYQQPSNSGIGTVSRRRARITDWNSLKQQPGTTTYNAAFINDVDQLGWDGALQTDETGFEFQTSRADRNQQLQQWDQEVERILAQDQSL